MAGGMALESGGTQFEGKFTFYVFLCGIIAATGGLMFGYDIGISGGVTAMDDFLEKFFHTVYVKKHLVHENNYCKYDNQGLQLFTSSLYLAALVASFLASKCCSKYGRKPTMQIASGFFLLGTVLCTSAVNLALLIIGRILLGFGVGFANQAVPLFLSEIAPTKYRGALNILFQLDVTIGILIANLVNYFASNIHPWGWRLSLGLAGVPASILCLGSFVIPETPTSLIEHGKVDKGHQMLKKVRGVENVEAELEELKHASMVAQQVKHPYRTLMKRPSRPPLVIAVMMQVFQQFTGINAIMFYAPVLFQTVGFKNDASLLSALITGSVNVFSTLISVFSVDKAGRRILLLSACILMLIAQTATGAILNIYLKDTNSLHRGTAIVRDLPLETRAAGFSFAVSANMLFTFLIAQAFLSMMCHMKSGIFLFFSAWIVLMSLFVIFLLPETKGVPIDEMNQTVWKKHWYWKRFVRDVDEPKPEV
ncbi:hypothetical protein HPP92_009998 [Vanilla planifolia]|uniref:Major facilitator superfamily (MFS) profile domain-containing protein n=1 Tax=Vanilla planifolia TaxID=51239 RepID=A0A835R4J9_VANPL|nr:hypothetical protein HPP92_010135 [Vanilla planifolia]KAG0481914.1 hypothetical protein HPP92_009998 [Vanilla planifolia]